MSDRTSLALWEQGLYGGFEAKALERYAAIGGQHAEAFAFGFAEGWGSSALAQDYTLSWSGGLGRDQLNELLARVRTFDDGTRLWLEAGALRSLLMELREAQAFADGGDELLEKADYLFKHCDPRYSVGGVSKWVARYASWKEGKTK